MRAPVRLYDLGLGWLLGRRFTCLTHVGRRSGTPASIDIGRTTFPADHRVLGQPEAVAVIADYERRH